MRSTFYRSLNSNSTRFPMQCIGDWLYCSIVESKHQLNWDRKIIQLRKIKNIIFKMFCHPKSAIVIDIEVSMAIVKK